MLHYAVLLRGLLGLDWNSLFNFDTMTGLASIVISGVALIILGYIIKGVWGAVITFSIGAFLFIYLKGLLPI